MDRFQGDLFYAFYGQNTVSSDRCSSCLIFNVTFEASNWSIWLSISLSLACTPINLHARYGYCNVEHKKKLIACKNASDFVHLMPAAVVFTRRSSTTEAPQNGLKYLLELFVKVNLHFFFLAYCYTLRIYCNIFYGLNTLDGVEFIYLVSNRNWFRPLWGNGSLSFFCEFIEVNKMLKMNEKLSKYTYWSPGLFQKFFGIYSVRDSSYWNKHEKENTSLANTFTGEWNGMEFGVQNVSAD